MTKDEFLVEAKALRDAVTTAEDRFFLFLLEGEQQRDIWAGTGQTFLQFLKQTNLCEPSRYDGWKRIRENHGQEVIDRVGVDAAAVIGAQLKDSKDQKEALDRAEKSSVANGVHPSAQTATGYANDVKTRNTGMRSGGAKGYSALTDENDRLKARVAELEAENAALKSELKKLKSDLKKTGTAKKKTTEKRPN